MQKQVETVEVVKASELVFGVNVQEWNILPLPGHGNRDIKSQDQLNKWMVEVVESGFDLASLEVHVTVTKFGKRNFKIGAFDASREKAMAAVADWCEQFGGSGD